MFWTQIAARAKHPIDFLAATGAVNDAVSRAARENGELGLLRAMLTASLVPAPTPRRAIGGVGRQGRLVAGSADGKGGEFTDRQQSEPEITLSPDE